MVAAACGGGENGSDSAEPPASSSDSSGGSSGGGECMLGGGEAPVGPCLVAMHAGTYTVQATAGAHARGTIVLDADGSVDYDEGLNFPIADFEGVYDRLECCMRISVEMNQRPDNDKTLDPTARHRVDIFLSSSAPGSDVVRFEYYPNWPSDQGKVDLDVAG